MAFCKLIPYFDWNLFREKISQKSSIESFIYHVLASFYLFHSLCATLFVFQFMTIKMKVDADTTTEQSKKRKKRRSVEKSKLKFSEYLEWTPSIFSPNDQTYIDRIQTSSYTPAMVHVVDHFDPLVYSVSECASFGTFVLVLKKSCG